jgi:hypothetical protein
VSISEIIKDRQITEVLHFTTRQGLTGILHQREVKARTLLRTDETLAFILKLNTEKVYDPEWKNYINLSISRINRTLFGISEGWHSDQEWRILSFDPEILCHSGVWFVTTNNAYWQHLRRGQGPAAFKQLFEPRVASRYGKIISRTAEMPDCWTTDSQAEVLYPERLSTKYLRKIYVRTDAESDSVASKLAALQHPQVPIEIRPEQF